MIKRNKTSIQIIDEIHHKVDISAEVALTEAKRIIEQSGDTERILRLEKVAASGFINAKEVIAAQKEVVELNLAKEKAKWEVKKIRKTSYRLKSVLYIISTD